MRSIMGGWMRGSEEEGAQGIIAGPFVLNSKDRRFTRLFREATMRPPRDTPRITTVRSASLSRRPTKTTVGLTRYSRVRYLFFTRPRQTITFYSSLMDSLSAPAVTAIIAHELAHAWLNEHVSPEESSSREREADALARKWGFGRELDALDQEAETVNAG
jgi:hypothetical protein